MVPAKVQCLSKILLRREWKVSKLLRKQLKGDLKNLKMLFWICSLKTSHGGEPDLVIELLKNKISALEKQLIDKDAIINILLQKSITLHLIQQKENLETSK